jgi:aspartate kinase
MEDPVVTGVASEGGYVQVVVRELPAEMESMTRLLARLSRAGVSVDLLAQLDTQGGRRDIELTVRRDQLEDARAECEAVSAELGGGALDTSGELARITLVGSGMHGRPGVYARAFEALHEEGVAVHAVSASSVSIILMVDAGSEERAIRVVHETFGLGEEVE